MDDSGFPEDTRQTTGLSGFRIHQSEVFRTMTSTRGPYNLGSSATTMSVPLTADGINRSLLVCIVKLHHLFNWAFEIKDSSHQNWRISVCHLKSIKLNWDWDFKRTHMGLPASPLRPHPLRKNGANRRGRLPRGAGVGWQGHHPSHATRSLNRAIRSAS
jgi:hypothetical protein